MNGTSTSDLVEHRLAEAVKNYVARVSVKCKKLFSRQEGILELRRKPASYSRAQKRSGPVLPDCCQGLQMSLRWPARIP
jgi:hypothetical protein